MNALLTTIVESKQQEIQQLRQKHSLLEYSQQPPFVEETRSLRQSLENKFFGIIAEIKRKSPGAGIIRADLNCVEQAQSYLEAGASGISVLTDYPFFGGSTEDLIEVRKTSPLPLLRKDFILDELQVFEARANGADAILLIASMLEKHQAHHLTIIAQSLGMEVVFEIHSIRELDKLNDEVDLLLVNNRNLDTQTTDVNHCLELANYLPTNIPAIAASGIRSIEEIARIRAAGYVGALVGESILVHQHLHELTQSVCTPYSKSAV